jgi:tetratricopeptide (TPR) repeat protein
LFDLIRSVLQRGTARVQLPIVVRADEARDRRQWHDAARLYRAYLEDAPNDFSRWVQCGHAEKELGRFDRALSCYRTAMLLDGTDADLHLQLGHLHKLMGQLDKAAESYRATLRLDPACEDAEREIGALGYVYKSRSQEPLSFVGPMDAPIDRPDEETVPDDSIEVSRSLLTDGDGLWRRVEQERRSGEPIRAAALLRVLVRLVPTEPLYWTLLAEVLEQANDPRQAARCRFIALSLSDRPR